MTPKTKNNKLNICAYCGRLANTTVDHIPPRCLFTKPHDKLIKVPACVSCHANTSKDDEYFRLKILMHDKVTSNPEARIVWEKTFNSLTRVESMGLKKKILADITLVNLMTKSGLFLGTHTAYNVDFERISKVIQRIVMGLYFKESGSPLGLDNHVRVYTEQDISNLSQDEQQSAKTLLSFLCGLTPQVIGNNIFIYRYYIGKKEPKVSVWGLSFYGHVPFLALTKPC